MMSMRITNKSGVRISYEQFARFVENEVRKDFNNRMLNEIGSWMELIEIVDVNEYLSTAVAFFRIDMGNPTKIHDTFEFLNNAMRATQFFLFNNNECDNCHD
jgi:hypothetical protein